MPKKLTKADAIRGQAYDAAKPDSLGNLHERMQAVMKRGQEITLWQIDNDLWQHIHDLQTEVAMHEPAKPPYGCRSIPREIATSSPGGGSSSLGKLSRGYGPI